MTTTPQPDLTELKDYWDHYQPIGISPPGYAGIKLTPDLAITAASIFYPSFVVHEGCVFIGSEMPEDSLRSYQGWKNRFGDDFRSIETKMNLRLVSHLFYTAAEDMGYQNIEYLGQILLKTWDSALRNTFLEREFIVQGGKDGNFDDYYLTFFHK